MKVADAGAPYAVLAAMEIIGGSIIVVYGIIPVNESEAAADLIAGTAAIIIGVLTATVLRRLGVWAAIASLCVVAVLMAYLLSEAESAQAQMGAGYGFILVAGLAGGLLSLGMLLGFLGLLMLLLAASYVANPQVTHPIYIVVIGASAAMVGIAFWYLVRQARSLAQRYRTTAERLEATWDSQLDPFVLLEGVSEDGSAITDLRIVEANAAARRAAGGIPQFVGASVRHVSPTSSDQALIARCIDCLTTGQPVLLDAYPLVIVKGEPARLYDIRGYRAGTTLAMTWQDVTERTRYQLDLDRRARFDDLTGCLNRGAGLELLAGMLPARRSGEQPPVVLFCDLDNFKAINDQWGHAAGDAVLREVAERITGIVRADDPVIRAGGDEFIVALGGTQSFQNGLDIADKVRLAVANAIETPAGPLTVTVSIGVASARPGQSVDDILAEADRAMYDAKQQGRNTVVAVSPLRR